MKKWLIVILLVIPILFYGQDVIVKTTGDSIKVKILSVTKNFVEFQYEGFVGASYNLSKDKIARIHYADGRVIKLNDIVIPSKKKNYTPHPYITNTIETKSTPPIQDTTTEEVTIDPKTLVCTESIIRNGNRYMFNGHKLDNFQLREFLRTTCPDAYQLNCSGFCLAKTGWILFGSGLLCNVAGIVILTVDNGYQYDGSSQAGNVLTSIGGTAVTTSIPLLCIGYCKMHRSAEAFNERNVRPYWQLQTSKNGLGIAYNF